ncbi:SIS domain-containing protein [Alkalihalobacillus sp. BA299]|uniref:SIS domain-containing protein n=1 Tax=Alkalihalobacillus sp. BA299 TaxID=2815938 RepID=UPI001AD9E6E3|nr:SIS domain-containing protein [Alkalihalobacillus sp. BA299]
MFDTYFKKIKELLLTIEVDEKAQVKQAAKKFAESIQQGGIIHVFGCGHSHILGEEVFYRAGGLVPVNPILVEDLMLHHGAVRSSTLERKQHFAEAFIGDEDIRETDCLIVVSTSGRNPVPIDVALYGKMKGAYVVGISSLNYVPSQPSRHESGKHLCHVVDLAINNHANIGDALIEDDQIGVPFGPSSTIIGAAIINSMIAEIIHELSKNGVEPPIFKSGNIDGSDEHNQRLIEKYKERIKRLQ